MQPKQPLKTKEIEMYVVIWNDERLQEFEESFEDLSEAQTFMEDLPNNAKLYYEDDVRVRRII
jgi:uncharacterized protein YfcZ (UPF0381/DUF406 family)